MQGLDDRSILACKGNDFPPLHARKNPFIRHPYTQVTVLSAPGKRGEDGAVGAAGRSGHDGNCLAHLDRSSLRGSSPLVIGDKDDVLEWCEPHECASEEGSYYHAHLQRFRSLRRRPRALKTTLAERGAEVVEESTREESRARETIQATERMAAYARHFQDSLKQSLMKNAPAEPQQAQPLMASGLSATSSFRLHPTAFEDVGWGEMSSNNDEWQGSKDYFVAMARPEDQAYLTSIVTQLPGLSSEEFAEIASLRWVWADETARAALQANLRKNELSQVSANPISVFRDKSGELQEARSLGQVIGGVELLLGDAITPLLATVKADLLSRGAVSARSDPTKGAASKAFRSFEAAVLKHRGFSLTAAQRVSIMTALRHEHHMLQQVATGEGKSLIIAGLAAVRCMLDPEARVDVVTSSSVLAMRDAAALAPIFAELGLSVAHNCDEDGALRQAAYKARVVYGDMAHFQRDYLVHTHYRQNVLGGRPQDYVIVDEVDNMLLDNGNNVLYLSHAIPALGQLDELLIAIFLMVRDAPEAAFDVERARVLLMMDLFGRLTPATLTGLIETPTKAFDALVQAGVLDKAGFLSIHDEEGMSSAVASCSPDEATRTMVADLLRLQLRRERRLRPLPRQLHAFVRAHLRTLIDNCVQALLMETNVEYVLDGAAGGRGGERDITIIDRNTGADLVASKWTGGLHQFLQLRHGCRLSPLSVKAIFISNVSFLKKYDRLDGLSGTLGSPDERATLHQLYNATLIAVPTNLPRRFIQYPPYVGPNEREWADEIYDIVRERVRAGRAVLVICDSIARLERLSSQLRRPDRAEKDERMAACLRTLTLYRRQNDEFAFERPESPLEAGKLVLATNLAGRGTDIHLSEEVKAAGGLHVVVAFLPRNLRIEEQAFGRAARAGQPGSAQLVVCAPSSALPRRLPSMVELKQHFVRAEQKRLLQLQLHYEHHTRLQEECLRLFSEDADERIFHSTAGGGTVGTWPQAARAIYGAMLDEFALLLDAKEAEIGQCETAPAKERERRKKRVIAAFAEFIKQHPITRADEAGSAPRLYKPTWLRADSALLALGLVQMSQYNGEPDAERTFLEVMAGGDDRSSALAYYYRACLRMSGLGRRPKSVNELVLGKDGLQPEGGVETAVALLRQARALLVADSARRAAAFRDVIARCGCASEAEAARLGLHRQMEAAIEAVGLIVANIDWLIGDEVTLDRLSLEFGPAAARSLHDSLTHLGLLSGPAALAMAPEPHHLSALQHEFGLSPAQVTQMLSGLLAEGGCVDRATLARAVRLPSRADFWRELCRRGVLREAEIVVECMRPSLVPSLTPFVRSPEAPGVVRFSNQSVAGHELHRKEDVLRALGPRQFDELVNKGDFRLDALAHFDVERARQTTRLDHFDHFTCEQLERFATVDARTAERLVSLLLAAGIVRRRDEPDLQKDLRGLQVDEKARPSPPGQTSRLEEYHLASTDVDCSTLSPALAPVLQAFLLSRFAHRLALNTLISAAEDAEGEGAMQVLLPEDAYGQLLRRMIEIGLVAPAQITLSRPLVIEHLNFDDFRYVSEVRLDYFLTARRRKLRDNGAYGLFKLTPVVDHLAQVAVFIEAGSELATLVIAGLHVLITAQDIAPMYGKFYDTFTDAKRLSDAAWRRANRVLAAADESLKRLLMRYPPVARNLLLLVKSADKLLVRKMVSPMMDMGVSTIVALFNANPDSFKYYCQLRAFTRAPTASTDLRAATSAQHRSLFALNGIMIEAEQLQHLDKRKLQALRLRLREIREQAETSIAAAIGVPESADEHKLRNQSPSDLMQRLTMHHWLVSELILVIEMKTIEARLQLQKVPESECAHFPCSKETLFAGLRVAYEKMDNELKEIVKEIRQESTSLNDTVKYELCKKELDVYLKRAIGHHLDIYFTAELERFVTLMAQSSWGDTTESGDAIQIKTESPTAKQRKPEFVQDSAFPSPLGPDRRAFLYGTLYKLAS